MPHVRSAGTCACCTYRLWHQVEPYDLTSPLSQLYYIVASSAKGEDQDVADWRSNVYVKSN